MPNWYYNILDEKVNREVQQNLMTHNNNILTAYLLGLEEKVLISVLWFLLSAMAPNACAIFVWTESLVHSDDVGESNIVGCLLQFADDWYWWKCLSIVDGEIELYDLTC